MTRRSTVHALRSLAVALVIGAVIQPAFAQQSTPAGKKKIRITTGTPKKKGVNQYVVKVSWVSDGGTKQTVTATANINGPDQTVPDTATTKAEKIARAIQTAINALPAASRGVRADQAQAGGADLPEVIIQNKAGSKLKKVKTGDGTNETDKKDTLAASFDAADVDSAIDICGAATAGTVEVTIGEGTPIVVETLDKTPAQIEEEIVEELNLMGIDASISPSSLLPDLEDPEDPFDGSEIQLLQLDAPSFTTDIDDPGLWVKNEFRFVPTVSEWGLIVMTLLLLTGAKIYFGRRRMKTTAA